MAFFVVGGARIECLEHFIPQPVGPLLMCPEIDLQPRNHDGCVVGACDSAVHHHTTDGWDLIIIVDEHLYRVVFSSAHVSPLQDDRPKSSIDLHTIPQTPHGLGSGQPGHHELYPGEVLLQYEELPLHSARKLRIAGDLRCTNLLALVRCSWGCASATNTTCVVNKYSMR